MDRLELRGELGRALNAAAAELRRRGEPPEEFYPVTAVTDEGIRISLWHRSAFTPDNCRVLGNPGGRNRDMIYDPHLDRITRTLWWQ